MAAKYPDAFADALVAEYAAGESAAHIARKNDIGTNAVLYVLRRRGVPIRTMTEARLLAADRIAAAGLLRRVLTDDQEADAVSRYADGESGDSIATGWAVDPGVVVRAIKRAGAHIRTVREVRRYTLNEAAFDCDPPTPDASYFAGLLMADGCVSIRDRSRGGRCGEVIIRLAEPDRPILERFAAFLQSDAPIATTYPRAERRQPMCSVSVSSLPLALSLARYGIVPRKTYTAAAPGFLLDNRDWWRGCVDGDGWVHFATSHHRRKCDGGTSAYRRPVLGLCGTREIVSQFRDFAVRNGLPNNAVYQMSQFCWGVTFKAGSAAALMRVLYGGCTVALPRKHQVAIEAMA